MKAPILCCFLILLKVGVFAQAKIPEIIKSDLTLSPTAKPYESTGFTVEKGATLTILPGTIIKITATKTADPILRINGGLIVGAKGAGNSKPVIINGESPAIVFKDATLDLNGFELTAAQVLFQGNCAGNIKNSKFLTGPNGVWYKMAIDVPKSGNLTFQDTLIEDKDLEIVTSDFPNDLDKLVFNKCSFTSKWSPPDKKFKLHLMSMMVFAYGTKCDCYINIEFKAFDWVLKKPLSTEWFIGDESQRKTLEGSAKLAKTYSLKSATKPFNIFKQEEAPAAKVEKK